jgi:hypothetical protein
MYFSKHVEVMGVNAWSLTQPGLTTQRISTASLVMDCYNYVECH